MYAEHAVQNNGHYYYIIAIMYFHVSHVRACACAYIPDGIRCTFNTHKIKVVRTILYELFGKFIGGIHTPGRSISSSAARRVHVPLRK